MGQREQRRSRSPSAATPRAELAQIDEKSLQPGSRPKRVCNRVYKYLRFAKQKSPDQTNPMQLQLLCWDLNVQVLEIPTCAIWYANMSEK